MTADDDETAVAQALDWAVHQMHRASRTTMPNGNPRIPNPLYVEWDRPSRQVVIRPDVTAAIPVGAPGVISISLQRWPGSTPDPASPLAVATAAASRHVPVVVAAGNWRRLGSGDTMSPFARLPGVLSVGATADESGTLLTASSSVGAPGGRGPHLVAWGRNEHAHDVVETSFAAPRVGGYALLAAAFLQQVSAVLTHLRTGRPTGAPLLMNALIDRGFAHHDPTPVPAYGMLPYGLGVDVDACRRARAALAAHDRDIDVGRTAHLVREVLLQAASGGPGEPHEVGAGMIDLSKTIDTLAALTVNDLFRWQAAARGDTTADPALAPLDDLDGVPLACADELRALFQVATGSRIEYGLDLDSVRISSWRGPPAR